MQDARDFCTDSLIRDVYSAALEPTLWPDVVANIAGMLGATAATLFSPGLTASQQSMHLHDFDPDGAADYQNNWYDKDEWTLGGARLHGNRSGSSAIGDQLISRNQLRKTGFGNEFARRYGVEQMIGAVLSDGSTSPEEPLTAISFFRDHRQNDFTDRDHERLRPLIPHLQHAVRIHRRLRRGAAEASLSQMTFDALADALFLLSAGGHILKANKQAQSLLMGAGEIGVAHGRIRQLGRRSEPSFVQALSAIRASSGVVRLLVDMPTQSPVPITATLHARPDVQLGAAWESDGPALSTALLVIQMPSHSLEATIVQIGPLYGWTSTEQRVAALLLDGLTAIELAAALNVKVPTVRSHISSLLAKSGRRRVVDLVRMLAALR